MALMTFDEYFKKYNGVGIDYDGQYSFQCFDLANHYCVNVLGGKAFIGMYAWEIYQSFNNQPSKNLFTRIANTPEFVPQKGDIIVWAQSLNGKAGHVAICDGVGDTTYFYSYEQNWDGMCHPTERVRHNYNHVLGVLRPKDQTQITGKKATSVTKTTSTQTTTTATKSNKAKLVIDISTWQPKVDYAKLAKEVNGIIIRVGYRGYGSAGTLCKDDKFDTHINGAVKNKIPYGFYFLSQALNATEGKAEADYVYSIIKKYSPTYPIYFDSELGEQYGNGRADKISKANRTAAAVAFCNRINELGFIGGIYASESWFTDRLDFNQIKKFSIWCAKYGSDNGTAQNKPTLSTYDGWQFTSKYKVSAISSGIDMSYFYVDFKTTTSTVTQTADKIDISVKDEPLAVAYQTMYVNDKSGVNYRATPNGTLKGTYPYGKAVKVLVGSDKKVGNYTWVKIDNGCYMAKELLSATKISTKSVTEIAKEVIAGKWGNGTDRVRKLAAAGYDYNAIQRKVNELLK